MKKNNLDKLYSFLKEKKIYKQFINSIDKIRAVDIVFANNFKCKPYLSYVDENKKWSIVINSKRDMRNIKKIMKEVKRIIINAEEKEKLKILFNFSTYKIYVRGI